MLRGYRKPLVVIAPKVLLRHPQAVSSVEDMQPGSCFQPVLADELQREEGSGAAVEQLILCSGKVYYDLSERRAKEGRQQQVAIVRVEELSPFPWSEVRAVLTEYVQRRGVRDVRWVQEEPRNAGAWSFVRERIEPLLQELTSAAGDASQPVQLRYVGRKPLAAAAVGSTDAHKKEVAELFAAAFN